MRDDYWPVQQHGVACLLSEVLHAPYQSDVHSHTFPAISNKPEAIGWKRAPRERGS